MNPTRENLIAALYAELHARTRPLPIILGDHREIQGITKGFNATLDYSCVFDHPDRSIEIGFNSPPRKMLLRADTQKFARLSYAAKESVLRKVAEKIGLPFDEYDPPWTRNMEGRSRDDAMKEWLEGKCGGESADEEEFLIGVLAGGEYLPGFAILDQMAQTDVYRLGMKELDIGGPASSVYAVTVDCSLRELSDALRRNELPFEVTDSRFP